MNTTIKYLFIPLFCLLNANVVNAQFLERLNKRVQRSAENAAISHAEKIAAEKAEEAIEKGISKGLESFFEAQLNGLDSISVKSVAPSELPDQYEFEWMYTLQMQTNDGLMNIDYFLKPEASYFGAKPKLDLTQTTEYIFMVVDIQRNINTIFMESNGTKMAMPSSVPLDTDFDSNDVDNSDNFTFTQIETKTILGYNCQGYKMENDDSITKIYVTKDAPVSFTQLFIGNNKNIPQGFDPKWLDKIDDSLIMEMEHTDKNENNTTTMKCILLNKNAFTISKSEYQFINFNMPSE
jgi:hypothetical protein